MFLEKNLQVLTIECDEFNLHINRIIKVVIGKY